MSFVVLYSRLSLSFKYKLSPWWLLVLTYNIFSLSLNIYFTWSTYIYIYCSILYILFCLKHIFHLKYCYLYTTTNKFSLINEKKKENFLKHCFQLLWDPRFWLISDWRGFLHKSLYKIVVFSCFAYQENITSSAIRIAKCISTNLFWAYFLFMFLFFKIYILKEYSLGISPWA